MALCAEYTRSIPYHQARLDYIAGHISYVTKVCSNLPLRAIIVGQSPYDHDFFPHYCSAFAFDRAKTASSRYCRDGVPMSVAVLANDAQVMGAATYEEAVCALEHSWAGASKGVAFLNQCVMSSDDSEFFGIITKQTELARGLIIISLLMSDEKINVFALGNGGQKFATALISSLPRHASSKVSLKAAVHPASVARRSNFGEMTDEHTLNDAKFTRAMWAIINSTYAASLHHTMTSKPAKSQYWDIKKKEEALAKETQAVSLLTSRVSSFRKDSVVVHQSLGAFRGSLRDFCEGLSTMTAMDGVSEDFSRVLADVIERCMSLGNASSTLENSLRVMTSRSDSLTDVSVALAQAKEASHSVGILPHVQPGGATESTMSGLPMVRPTTIGTRTPVKQAPVKNIQKPKPQLSNISPAGVPTVTSPVSKRPEEIRGDPFPDEKLAAHATNAVKVERPVAEFSRDPSVSGHGSESGGVPEVDPMLYPPGYHCGYAHIPDVVVAYPAIADSGYMDTSVRSFDKPDVVKGKLVNWLGVYKKDEDGKKMAMEVKNLSNPEFPISMLTRSALAVFEFHYGLDRTWDPVRNGKSLTTGTGGTMYANGQEMTRSLLTILFR